MPETIISIGQEGDQKSVTIGPQKEGEWIEVKSPKDGVTVKVTKLSPPTTSPDRA
ncbi:MAG: hypothetical protein WC503_05635 [Candidatus Shapirobacteria bacterium]